MMPSPLAPRTVAAAQPQASRRRYWHARKDALGNALGDSIVAQSMSSGSVQTAYQDGDIGRGELRWSSAPPPNIADLSGPGAGVGFGGYVPASVDRSEDVLLAAGDGFTMGRGPVSVGQSGRTIYISDQGQPSIDSMLADAQSQLAALKSSSAAGSDPAVVQQVIVTGQRMTDPEKAAYDAQQFQEENDARVAAGAYDRFGAFGDALSAGQYGDAWRHIVFEASDRARAASVARTFPQPSPDAQRLNTMLGSPIGTTASLVARGLGGSQRAQDIALEIGAFSENAVGGALGLPRTVGPSQIRLASPPREPLPFSPLSQPGGLSATEGGQVRRADGRLSDPTHPLEKHGPDATNQYIMDRVVNELQSAGRTGLRTAFNDRAQMEAAIAETLKARGSDINAWLSSAPRAGVPRAFEWDPGMGNLGRGFEVASPGGPVVSINRPMPNVNLVLIPDGRGGFLIHTAHPKP